MTFNQNDSYMGSSQHLKRDIKKIGIENFKKEILHVFDKKEDMMNKEAEIVTQNFCNRPDTYNRYVGGANSFCSEGMVTVINPEGGYMNVYNDNPRWLSGELKAAGTGKVAVKDKDGNVSSVSKTDPKYLSDELISIKCGIVNPNLGNYWRGRKGTEGINKSHSEETRKKLIQANKNNGRAKELYIYDLHYNFIEKIDGRKEYARDNDLNYFKIWRTLKGKQKFYKDKVYSEIELTPDYIIEKRNLICSQYRIENALANMNEKDTEIFLYDKSGEFLGGYSFGFFCIEADIHPLIVKMLLNNESPYDYHNKYRVFHKFNGDLIDKLITKKTINTRSKRVMNVSTGQIYDEIKLAAIDLKTSLSGLAQRIREGKKCKGIEFVYC